jgi:DNA-damage-inducible protein J
MSKTAVIHARTDRDLKLEVENILKTLGLSTTAAINIFFNQIRLRKALPFPVDIPNTKTKKTGKRNTSK